MRGLLTHYSQLTTNQNSSNLKYRVCLRWAIITDNQPGWKCAPSHKTLKHTCAQVPQRCWCQQSALAFWTHSKTPVADYVWVTHTEYSLLCFFEHCSIKISSRLPTSLQQSHGNILGTFYIEKQIKAESEESTLAMTISTSTRLLKTAGEAPITEWCPPPAVLCHKSPNTETSDYRLSLPKRITAALETLGLLQGLHSPSLCSHCDVWELAQRSEKPAAAR